MLRQLLAVSLMVTSCGFVGGFDGEMEILPLDRPERFEFFMQPGSGVGPVADDLVAGLGPRLIAGSAEHVASADTPTGRFSVVTFRTGEVPGGHCIGMASPNGGSTTCDEGPIDFESSGFGWSSDGMWNDTQLYGPKGTVKAEVLVGDATTYTIHTHERWGVLVWSAARGDLSEVRYFDADGEVLK